MIFIFYYIRTEPGEFYDRVAKYITKVNQNKKFSYRVYFEELTFNLTIKNLTLTDNINIEDKLTIKHEIDMEISKLNDISQSDDEGEVKVIKHTWYTKFKVKISPNLDNPRLKPENLICVGNKAEDYMRDYLRWSIMLDLSNI